MFAICFSFTCIMTVKTAFTFIHINRPHNPKIIVSNAVANPTTGNRLAQGRFGRFGGGQNQFQQQFANFAIGGIVPARINGQFVNFTISDISYYFPAIANVLNQAADSLRYAIVDYRPK